MRLTNSILFIITICFFFGCKVQKSSNALIVKELPASFNQNSETVKDSISLLDWRMHYLDPSLRALIDTALKKNFDLNIALQKIEVARAGFKSVRGIRLPDLNAYIGAGQQRFGEYTMDGVGNFDTQFSPNLNANQVVPNPLQDYSLLLQSSWEIDVWGKLKNKKKAAINRFVASQHGRDFIITNLISEIAYQYFDLVTLDSEIKIIQANIILQQNALNTVEAQKASAKVNELAVEVVAAQLLNTKAMEAELKQKLVECESKLSYLCGGFPNTIKRAAALQDTSIQEISNIGIPSDLLRHRPDIKEAEKQLIASKADVNSARAAFYPSININSTIGFQAFNAMLLLESPASLAYSFMGGLTAPLLNRRKIKADLMVAKAEQRLSYINYESKVVNGFMEVYNAVNNINNTNDMIRFKLEEVDILKKSVETSAELFKAGRANYLEVIYSQKNALQTQLELADYRKKLNVAKVRLYRSLGGGWK